MMRFARYKYVAILALALALILLPCFSMADDNNGDYNGIHWELDKNGVLTFTSDSLQELPQSGPWEGCSAKAKTIVIGEGIKKLNVGTFNNLRSLTTISLGQDLEEMSEFAFSSCKNVKKLILLIKKDCFNPGVLNNRGFVIELGVESPYIIQEEMLLTKERDKLIYGPSKGKVIIPDGVKIIGKNAFFLSKITEVSIPATVETIEDSCFRMLRIKICSFAKECETYF